MQIGEERYREIHYDVPSLAQEKLFGKARSCSEFLKNMYLGVQ